MKLSDVAIQKPVFAWMLMAGLLVFGGLGVQRLGVSRLPDVDFPQVTVNLVLEGASPETMETTVVEIVEDACTTVEGIKDISSTSRQGAATVTVEFELGRDVDAALQDVQAKIAQAQRRLPADLEPPVVNKSNPEDDPILWVAVTGPRNPQELSDLARYTLKEQIQTVPGVGEIQMGGFRERSLRVWLDAERMDAFGVTAGDVLQALRREHVEVPAGRIESGSREVNVRMRGEAIDVEGFANLIVLDRGEARVRIRDIGAVEDGLEDRRRISRTNGVAAQGLGIKKQRGANAVAVAHGVRDRLEELRKTLPEDLDLSVTFDATGPVEDAIHEIFFTLGLAVLLTALVCWFFLGSISSTVNVLLSIPTSIVGTFAVMYFLGFTLNTFTLLGLSLAVGVVVDDAIMVLENIFRRAEDGEGRIRAAVAGAREIAFAALAASAAIVAIFLPVAFMQGAIGAFFFQFGVTISVAVLLSLLEALTLTPSRSAQFLSVGERRTPLGRAVDRGLDGLAALYRWSLRGVLRLRWLVLLVGVGLFLASLQILPLLKQELVPSEDMGVTMVRVQTPPGASIDLTDDVLRKVERILLARSDVQNLYTAMGGRDGGEVNRGIAFVTLTPRGTRAPMTEFVREVRGALAGIPDARVSVQDLSQRGFTARRGYPVEFTIRGPSWSELGGAAERLTALMDASPTFRDVDSDYQVGMPEVQILPDRDRAAAAGVSMQDIAATVNALVGGVRAGTYEAHGRRYDIRVRLFSGLRTREQDIGLLRVRARNGELVPLSNLVSLENRPSLLAITRQGRERAITMRANVGPESSQARAIQEALALARETLPPGYRAGAVGSSETLEDSFRQLLFAMLLGVAVAYMILASQFNSFVHPFTVLAALPFSLSGALAGLYLLDLSLNLYSFIGIILLMGIVKKNSILLVEFTNQRRLLGLSRDAALLDACPIRLRPILMTSVSTIAGALPVAFAAGPGGEVRQPMAVAVVGGVAVSTLLTLFVVPALYSVLDTLTARISRAAKIERETRKVIAELDLAEMERRAASKVGAGEER
jgi:hydrophobe/amphiphile efflux-1 (HAE1) family protein